MTTGFHQHCSYEHDTILLLVRIMRRCSRNGAYGLTVMFRVACMGLFEQD